MLLDIGMPVMDGYEVALTIRERPWGRDVEIVALTSWGQQGKQCRSQEAGIDRHRVKPVAPDTLERLLIAPETPWGRSSHQGRTLRFQALTITSTGWSSRSPSTTMAFMDLLALRASDPLRFDHRPLVEDIARVPGRDGLEQQDMDLLVGDGSMRHAPGNDEELALLQPDL